MKTRIACLRLLDQPVRESWERLVAACDQFSPLVGWETVAGESRGERSCLAARGAVSETRPDPLPSRLLLDVTGIGRLFGGDAPLADGLLRVCRETGCRGCVAIADTLSAAWACVETLGDETAWIVPPGESEQAVREAPLAGLRLPDPTRALLGQLGIERIGQLFALPRDGLAVRFGPLLGRRLDQIAGTAVELIRPYRPLPPVRVERCWDEPTEDREWLVQQTNDMLKELTDQLRRRGEGALQLHGRFDCAPGRPLEVRVGLFQPTASPDHLAQLLQLQCERLAWPGPVGRVALAVAHAVRLQPRQGLLFDDPSDAGGADANADRERELGGLIERLSSRLGASAVLQAVPRSDPLPERAFRYEPAVERRGQSGATRAKSPRSRGGAGRGERAGRTEQAAAAGGAAQSRDEATRAFGEPARGVGYRPLRLRHPPPALDVLAVAPSGPPAVFQWERRSHRVARHWGPERIETGWWRGGSIRRDYYRVETSEGLRFWLFRDLVSGGWFLHGVFA